MDDATRLVCPECGLVYRVKSTRPGKKYKCTKCGGPLRGMEPGDGIANPATGDADARAFDVESGIASENIAAMSSTRRVAGPDKRPEVRDSAMYARLESQVARLSGLLDSLSEKAGEAGGGSEATGAEADKLRDELYRLLGEVEGKLFELGRKFDGDISAFLSERVKDAGDMLLSRLEERRAAIEEKSRELAETGAEVRIGGIDVQDLADRLAAGLGAAPTSGEREGSAAIASLAKATDDLAREQSVVSERLTALTEETRNILAALSRLDGWRGDLPIQITDEIGRTVEDRVVGPISAALARQAPAILSGMRDDKLVDIVSRSVREAQRPFLREILAGSRGGGVPLWLFASILLPLLLILGYLFLPGEFGFGDAAFSPALENMSENLARMESDGVLLVPDTEDRLRNVEAMVMDIRGQALNHARNAAAIEEEARGLRVSLAEKDGLIKEYADLLQKQMRRLRAYEMTLTRLGVSPESIPE